MTQETLRKLKKYNDLLQFVLEHPHTDWPAWLDMVWSLLEAMLEISTKATRKPKGKTKTHNEKRTRNRKTRRA